MDELQPGLWTWTAPHPDWTPDQGGPDGWDRDVRSYAYDAGMSLVLVDPLSPPPAVSELAADRPVAVVLTCAWHQRSATDCVARYGAQVYAPDGFDERLEAPATAYAPGEQLPGDVVARPASYPQEAVLWIAAHGALVFGDALLGDGRGGVKIQESWLPEGTTRDEYREPLRALLELPVELVLPTHGDPVATGARDALARALDS